MKTITINVSEPIYRDFMAYAKKQDRTTSELIRAAMEEFHAARIARSTTLKARRPASVGGPIHPLGPEDDLLGEMLGDLRD